MKKLYLDCGMGAAGDMLTAALYELLPEPQLFLEKMNSLGLSEVHILPEISEKCGVMGTHMSVIIGNSEEFDEHDHIGTDHRHDYSQPHEHNSGPYRHNRGRPYTYEEIRTIISSLDIGEKPKQDALCVYELIAKVEAKVHGSTEGSVHFHEVGALDAIADIIGVCVLIDMLGVSDISCSPVHVGSGTVKCAHGILPVPVPAAAELLRGIPIYGGEVRGELCTPTGAALLRHFVSRFGPMDALSVEKTGYGMGKRDFDRCNCVRAFLGESMLSGEVTVFSGDDEITRITELSCNLDDMTPEALGFSVQVLLDAGALDVFTTPIFMKKNRSAYMLTIICRPDETERFIILVFKHTSTLGVRIQTKQRAVLKRSVAERDTKLGMIRFKVSEGFGVYREKPEYEDVAGLARKHGIPFSDILKEL